MSKDELVDEINLLLAAEWLKATEITSPTQSYRGKAINYLSFMLFNIPQSLIQT